MGAVWDVCVVVYGIRMPMGDLVGFGTWWIWVFGCVAYVKLGFM